MRWLGGAPGAALLWLAACGGAGPKPVDTDRRMDTGDPRDTEPSADTGRETGLPDSAAETAAHTGAETGRETGSGDTGTPMVLGFDDAHAEIVVDGASFFGDVVAGGGDGDGDGAPDLLVAADSAPDADVFTGALYAFAGPVEGRLDQADAVASWQGSAWECMYGCALAWAGDIDGDGLDDVVLGGGQAGEAGEAYLFHGPHAGALVPDATLSGESDDDNAGAAVAAGGDLNGDGLADLLVGAPWDVTGWTYALYGPVDGDESLAEADAMLRGVGTGEQAGDFLAGAGDADGDGMDDVLIGTGDGTVYVQAGPITGEVDLWYATATIEGDLVSAAGVGDTDGDGHADIVVGSTLADVEGRGRLGNYGAAYLFSGAPSGALSADAADATLYGTVEQGKAGWTVAAAGDTDADGLDDVLVAAPYGADWTGRVHLARGPLSGVSSLDDAAVTWVNDGYGVAGRGLSTAGDMDGDGLPDVVVGAPNIDTVWLVLAP